MNYFSLGIKIRYINFSCYEIVLPNGKVIVLDPCLSMEGFPINSNKSFSRDDYTGADYILISHTHIDHIADVSYLSKKFNSKIFVGGLSAFSLAQCENISLDQIYPCWPNSRFDFDDLSIEIYQGKHSTQKSLLSINETRHRMSCDGEYESNIDTFLYGSLEYCDFMITTKNNLRIYISGGQLSGNSFNNFRKSVSEKVPNIVFKQVSRKSSPEDFAEYFIELGCPLIFPLHQEGIKPPRITIETNEWFEKINQHLDVGMKIINPIPLEWYSIGFNVINI